MTGGLASGAEVERAVRLLAENAASLSLDQRLRLAALLARPIEPEPPRATDVANLPPAEAVVLTVEEAADQLTSLLIGRLRRIRYADVIAYLDQAGQHQHSQ